jgi:hypothetical protein
MKINRHEVTALLAALAIAANLFLYSLTQGARRQETEQEWRSAVEGRLTRLETKMDRLLNVNQAAIDWARERLPKTR